MGARNNVMALAVKLGWQWTLPIDFLDLFMGRFSTSLNRQMNGSSSNPVILFEELDRIVHVNDHNHSRLEQLRFRLSNWIAGAHLSKWKPGPSPVEVNKRKFSAAELRIMLNYDSP
jgi:hypothetical protein